MEIIPAIDIMGGQCVRLSQGDFNSAIIYERDPVAMALRLAGQGFRRLHLVDLDAARSGSIQPDTLVARLQASSGLSVGYSGGIRTEADLDHLFAAGAQWLTIGSMAVQDPVRVREWLNIYGTDRFIIAADVAAGKVLVKGWQEATGVSVLDLIARYYGQGLRDFMCTDISCDGMLGGPAFDLYALLLRHFPGIQLIASGGVSSVDDIRRLEEAGCSAVIVGKALYEAKIRPEEVQAWL